MQNKHRRNRKDLQNELNYIEMNNKGAIMNLRFLMSLLYDSR